MPDEKAPRNKTIDTTLESGKRFLERCVFEADTSDYNNIIDKTVNGDMFTVCPSLPDGFADLIIADPPYNLTKDFNGAVFSKRKESEYEKYTESWLSLMPRLLREGGSIYVCCDWRTSLTVGRILGKYFTLQNRITWQREKGRGAGSNWKNGMEDIWFATKGGGHTFNLDAVKIRRRVLAPYKEGGKPKDWVRTKNGAFRDTCPSNFWDDMTVPFWSMPENTAHPTQKPEKLIAKIMLASSNAGDTVFDPFLGSGTTSVVAKKLGRHYLGIESNPLYCVWAEQRIDAAESDKRIQGYSNGVFWARNEKYEPELP